MGSRKSDIFNRTPFLGKDIEVIKDISIASNVNIIMPGFLSENELFEVYCAADVFMSTTIADSGPMMVNYSIACGTPVVSFPIGVAQDLVMHKKQVI